MRLMYTVGALLALATTAGAQETNHALAKAMGYKYPMPVGTKLNDVIVVDLHGHRTISFPKGKATVLVFVASDCPTSRSYDEYMHTLYQEYANKNVQFGFLDAYGTDGPGGSGGKWKDMVMDTSWTDLPPIVLDSLSEVANLVGAVNTPEAYVFDSTGTLRYRGALTPDGDMTKEYVRMALDAIMTGKPVPVTTTPTFGCSVHGTDPDGWGQQ